MAELTFDTQEAVPEPFRPIAEAKDGKFVIDVIPSRDLKEFRDRNVELSRERDDNQSFFAKLTADLGLDPEKYDDFVTQFSEMKNTVKLVEDGKLVKDTSLDEALDKRTREMKKEHENLVNNIKNAANAHEQENKKLKQELALAQVDREFIPAIGNPKSAALPEATDLILQQAYAVFKPNEDGVLIPRDRENKIIYGADGSTPMTPLEWLGKLREERPFMFKRSEGGGGQGGQGRNGMTAADIAKLSPTERMNLARA